MLSFRIESQGMTRFLAGSVVAELKLRTEGLVGFGAQGIDFKVAEDEEADPKTGAADAFLAKMGASVLVVMGALLTDAPGLFAKVYEDAEVVLAFMEVVGSSTEPRELFVVAEADVTLPFGPN